MFLQQVSLLSSDISQISRFDAFSWETQRAAWQHLAWALCNEMKQGCCGRCLLFFSSCGSCLVKRNFVSFNLPPDSKRFIQHLFGSMGMPRSYNGTCWTCLFCLGISGSGFWQISTCIGAVSLDTVWASQWLSDARDLGNSVGLWPVQHLLRLLMKSSFHAETLERLDLLSKVVPCAGQRWRRYALMWMCLVLVEIATQALFILDGISGVGRNLRIGWTTIERVWLVWLPASETIICVNDDTSVS